MVNWKLVYTKQAQKDAKKLSAANLRTKAEAI
ncbi:MAG: Txe/YoeB family addiction module toxin, partial [Candidatus Scalindua sp.]|nr:Txe/YoeB family addiction module toxin [Candidatus Scalindua sp.]